MTQIDYQTLNERCEKALKEIDINPIDTWLHLASKLFKAVSIQTEGLPSIANANFEGVHYKFISEFHKEYLKRFSQIKKE